MASITLSGFVPVLEAEEKLDSILVESIFNLAISFHSLLFFADPESSKLLDCSYDSCEERLKEYFHILVLIYVAR